MGRPRDANYSDRSSRPVPELERELLDVDDVARRSREYESRQFAEPAWNEDVHGRVMEIALRCCEGVARRNM